MILTGQGPDQSETNAYEKVSDECIEKSDKCIRDFIM